MNQMSRFENISDEELTTLGLTCRGIWQGLVGGHKQLRAQLYTPDGRFVAFVCRRTIPANPRRNREEATYTRCYFVEGKSFQTSTRFTAEQKNAAKRWVIKILREFRDRPLDHPSR